MDPDAEESPRSARGDKRPRMSREESERGSEMRWQLVVVGTWP